MKSTVDCSDVATIVCTFANLLGANLYQDKLSFPLVKSERRKIPALKLKGIGWHDSEIKGINFTYHEVAWDGRENGGNIWDASFSLIGQGGETLAINRPLSDTRSSLLEPGSRSISCLTGRSADGVPS